MRMMTHDEDPLDVIKKINNFIGNSENTDSLISDINDIINKMDSLEMTINNIGDMKFKNAMLNYLTNARSHISNIIDIFDEMMRV